MRTVKREVEQPNKAKMAALVDIAQGYALEKQFWLKEFQKQKKQPLILLHRQLRDAAVAIKYTSVGGLQARMWKLALVDAAQTLDKYWQAIIATVRQQLGGHKSFSPTEKHYGNWLLFGYHQFFECLNNRFPEASFDIDYARCKKVAKFIRRRVLALRGAWPRVKIARSFVLDADCYSVFVKNNVQYLKIMTRKAGKRLVLRLKGHVAIAGNIRVVIDAGKVRVHTSHKLADVVPSEDGNIVAIDLGYKEACVTATGSVYGPALGELMTRASDARHVKGVARNKLRSVGKKAHAKGQKQKAKNVATFNLGTQKQRKTQQATRAQLDNTLNAALNSLIREEKLKELVTEWLRHAFSFNKPPKWNRRLSAWLKGVAQDRIEFKALAEGFRHTQVNPAYTSQECPKCGFVDRKNRRGDDFVCQYCGFESHADWVGAVNIRKRRDDAKITRYMPYREVKALLLARFHRRLETEGARRPEVTVPGRTAETVASQIHCGARDENHSGEALPPLYPTVTRRAKQKKIVGQIGDHDI